MDLTGTVIFRKLTTFLIWDSGGLVNMQSLFSGSWAAVLISPPLLLRSCIVKS